MTWEYVYIAVAPAASAIIGIYMGYMLALSKRSSDPAPTHMDSVEAVS